MREFDVHLVSDATGETVKSIARACVAQFTGVRPREHFYTLVRTDRQLQRVVDGITAAPGPVIMSIIDPIIRERLEDACHQQGVPVVPVLDVPTKALATYLGQNPGATPGRQHVLDAEYFARIDALGFAMSMDDGQMADKYHEADVILCGVSRTSKTPTCIYLANRGIRAANCPFVPGVPLPPELDEVKRPLVVGLTNDPDMLIAIRRARLKLLATRDDTSYVDAERVREEVAEARRYFNRRRWPVINVARRSIEETAAEIMMLLSFHREAMAKAAAARGEETRSPALRDPLAQAAADAKKAVARSQPLPPAPQTPAKPHE